MNDIHNALQQAASALQEEPNLSDHSDFYETAVTELNLGKILLVDDDASNMFLMETILEETGLKLRSASTGEAALQIAQDELPVLIISDVQMSGMNGFELVEHVKSNPRTQHMGVVLVTAFHRSAKFVSQGLTMGADDYITRPFTPDEFKSRVEAVLRTKTAEAEVRRQANLLARRSKGLELVNELMLTINSSLDFPGVVSAALQKLSELLQAEVVALWLFNETQHELVVSISSYAGQHVSLPLDIRSIDEVSRLVRQEQVPPMMVDILNKHRDTLAIDPVDRHASIHCVPMLSRKQKVVGATVVVNKLTGDFDVLEWSLIQSATAIITVAAENAHLLEVTQQRVDDMIALNEIGQALTSTLDLEEILQRTTLLTQWVLQSDAISIWLLDDTQQYLELIASSGVGSESTQDMRIPIDSGIMGQVVQTGEPFQAGNFTQALDSFSTRSVTYHPKSVLCVPIAVKGETIGVIQALHKQANWFDSNHLSLSVSIANFIGIAAENARLFRQVQGFNQHLEWMVMERTQQLREEKEKTDAILASMADGLLVLDADNCVLTANSVAAGMLNCNIQTLVGYDIASQKLQHPLWQGISSMVNQGQTTADFVIKAPTQKELSIQGHAAKVRNENGQVIGTVLVLHDITSLKEVEMMKAQFMAGVTHELKTPLSVIRLQTENLLAYNDRLPTERRKQVLERIQVQTVLLGQLIEDILELSRFDSGVDTTQRETLDLSNLIATIVHDLQPLADSKHIRLHWTPAPTAVLVSADPKQLGRVIRNLVDNAIKYTRDSGRVYVLLGIQQVHNQPMAQFVVKDTGIGIPEEHQARIFERFYRIDPSHTIPGTGLGLAIVTEIIRAYGGTIHLDSVLNQGSTFTVLLPITQRA